MNKIKCIKLINDDLIPIHNICRIAKIGDNCYIWTNNDVKEHLGWCISPREYNKLLNELEII